MMIENQETEANNIIIFYQRLENTLLGSFDFKATFPTSDSFTSSFVILDEVKTKYPQVRDNNFELFNNLPLLEHFLNECKESKIAFSDGRMDVLNYLKFRQLQTFFSEARNSFNVDFNEMFKHCDDILTSGIYTKCENVKKTCNEMLKELNTKSTLSFERKLPILKRYLDDYNDEIVLVREVPKGNIDEFNSKIDAVLSLSWRNRKRYRYSGVKHI